MRFLTGRGNYVAAIKRPGMVAGVFVRSPHAHTAIKSIDAAAALAAPGVLAVITGADLKVGTCGVAVISARQLQRRDHL
jgi:aerobic carbon-monoxide dehydrogenase large subunit